MLEAVVVNAVYALPCQRYLNALLQSRVDRRMGCAALEGTLLLSYTSVSLSTLSIDLATQVYYDFSVEFLEFFRCFGSLIWTHQIAVEQISRVPGHVSSHLESATSLTVGLLRQSPEIAHVSRQRSCCSRLNLSALLPSENICWVRSYGITSL